GRVLAIDGRDEGRRRVLQIPIADLLVGWEVVQEQQILLRLHAHVQRLRGAAQRGVQRRARLHELADADQGADAEAIAQEGLELLGALAQLDAGARRVLPLLRRREDGDAVLAQAR